MANLLAEAESNNRDLPDPGPADLCLKSEDNHKNILLLAKPVVNDIYQARSVPIVLVGLSDKKI
jgi:hypothetical protein